MDPVITSLKEHVAEHCVMAQEQREKNAAYDLVLNEHMQKIEQLAKLADSQTMTIKSMLKTIDNLTSQLLTLQQYVSKNF